MGKIECPSCGATGLYKGICEPARTAVVCARCQGTGCTEPVSMSERVIPFTGRKKKPDISYVMVGVQSFYEKWPSST